jgi:hypothetical protein
MWSENKLDTFNCFFMPDCGYSHDFIFLLRMSAAISWYCGDNPFGRPVTIRQNNSKEETQR